MSDHGPPPAHSSTVALATVAALLFVPLTVMRAAPGDLTFVLPWALVNTAPVAPDRAVHVYTLAAYLGDPALSFGSLPRSLQAWPVALAFHLLAVVSAAGGRLAAREDRRVTAGLLGLAGVASLWVVVGLGSRVGATVGTDGLFVPVGAVVTWAVAIACYRDAFGGGLLRPRRG